MAVKLRDPRIEERDLAAVLERDLVRADVLRDAARSPATTLALRT